MSDLVTAGLEGQTAVVTGASGGLGSATARRLLASGAKVVLWDKNETTLSQTREGLLPIGSCCAEVVDVTSEFEVSAGVAKVIREHGRVDILINGAGIVGPLTPLSDCSLEDWRQVLEVNLTATFLCCREFSPAMVTQGYGRILNVASMAGKEGNPNQAAYSSAKAGVIALTKVISKELAETGVLVNAIAPASIDGVLIRAAFARDSEVARSAAAKIPMGRLGMPEEFAAMACWIVSKECSFTTGFTFDLSGGRAVY